MKRLLAVGLLLAGGAAFAQQSEFPQAGVPAPTGSAPYGAAQPAQAPQGGPPPAPKPVTLSSRPGATGGEAQYLEHCSSCHGPNGMGTGLLARRVQPALLEARDALPAAYVVLAARQGIGNMPPIPRGAPLHSKPMRRSETSRQPLSPKAKPLGGRPTVSAFRGTMRAACISTCGSSSTAS